MFHVERSASIKATPEKIFPFINTLSAFHAWEPFSRQDPNIKITYGGPESGKDAYYSWSGNGKVGEGRVLITGSEPATKIAMQLDMVRPLEAHNDVLFTITPQGGDSTLVKWEMSGTRPLIGKVADVVFNMDKMVGGAFQEGLVNLKSTVEK